MIGIFVARCLDPRPFGMAMVRCGTSNDKKNRTEAEDRSEKAKGQSALSLASLVVEVGVARRFGLFYSFGPGSRGVRDF